MNYLCSKCSELKGKKDLNIFDDYCSKCKKLIRKNDPEFYKKEYQRLYREANKDSLANYGTNYRKNNLSLIKSNPDISDINKSRSRLYISQIGDDKLKIGATHIDSKRSDVLSCRVRSMGISYTPLFYYDCKNADLITIIERKLKKKFCSKEYGINLDSFKNELTHISKLKAVCSFIELKLEESGLRYSIVEFR